MEVTTEQFEEFKQEFIYWQEKFGLTDWRIVFEKRDLEGDLAGINPNVAARSVTVIICDTCEDRHQETGWFNPKYQGQHEAMHLLLATYSWLAEQRYVNKEWLYQEEEAIVMKLQNAFKTLKETLTLIDPTPPYFHGKVIEPIEFHTETNENQRT